MSEEKAVTRKSASPIKVYCLPEEKRQIHAQAKRAGLSDTAYLRKVGLGYEIKGVVDYEQVRELARMNGDLGRLGGLLKFWLSNDERTKEFGADTIRAILKRIERTQGEMSGVMSQVVKPRSNQ